MCFDGAMYAAGEPRKPGENCLTSASGIGSYSLLYRTSMRRTGDGSKKHVVKT